MEIQLHFNKFKKKMFSFQLIITGYFDTYNWKF